MAEHSQTAARAYPGGTGRRATLIGAALILCLAVTVFAGARYGLLLAVGLGFGITLEGCRFGFAGPWRAMILRREPAGILAQFIAIGIVAIIAIPLLQSRPTELSGAIAPVGWSMVGGAFVFGMAMEIVLGCGSGTLVNAGSGNPVGFLSLPFFAIGSFYGANHVVWWTGLGSAPPIALTGTGGTVITILGLIVVGGVLLYFAKPEARRIPRRYLLAAALLAFFALANLAIAGQPWGVVYGLGLWAAKGASALGMDVSQIGFWSAPGNAERLRESILTDVTSLTNLGILGGALLVAIWRGGLAQKLPRLPLRAWIAVVISGFLLGYSSRLAFGCNVGGFFSGVSTGSLHGWAWFFAGFAGSALGVKLRPLLGLEARR